MNKICTDIEQSKRLIELGIDANTDDMWWAERYRGHTTKDYQYIVDDTPFYYLSFTKPSDDNYSLDAINDIPAWSLSALLELTPTFTLNGFGNGQFNFRDERANNYALVDTCPLDAAFEMVCWLLENKKL